MTKIGTVSLFSKMCIAVIVNDFSIIGGTPFTMSPICLLYADRLIG